MHADLTRLWVLAALLVPLSAEAQESKRLALLIANQGYAAEIGPLKNPHNDIRHVGAALVQIGFNIGSPLREATREQILLAVHDFADHLKAAGPGAVSFLYYSGHGVAVGGENLLVPVNVRGASSRELEILGVRLAEVVAALNERAPHAAHFVVFDACRNNLGGARGSRGFVPQPERPGMLVAFSTSPGNTASDEGSGSGPYAAALAAEMVVPGRNHDDMFFEVRKRVAELTRQEQVPWTQDGLLRQVHFGGPTAAPMTGKLAPQSEAEQVWLLTKESRDKTVLEAFIARFGDTFYAEMARAQLREIAQGKIAALAKPAPPSLATEHPFDGIWLGTHTATVQSCPLKSGTRTYHIQGSKLEDPIASVTADGKVTFVTPAAANTQMKVRHTLKLVGDGGTGSYQTIGGPCAGSWTLQRMAGPALGSEIAQGKVAALAKPGLPAGRFHGTWLVTRTGGKNCRTPKFEFRLVISNDRVGGKLAFGEINGTVSKSGAINFAHPNNQKGAPDHHYTGNLAGRGGTGTFEAVGGPCRGTFVATLE